MLPCRSILTATASLLRRASIVRASTAASAGQLADPDMPVEMEDPYKKPIKKCILCQQDVPLDYKNSRLLSQFVSPYTGRIYGRHITGLCQPMQERIAELIQKSQKFGYMAQNIKETYFLSDPALFRNPLSGVSRGKSAAASAAKAAANPKKSAVEAMEPDDDSESK